MDLATILNPYSVPAFLDQYFGRDFLHVPGLPAKFSGLIPRQTVDAMLADPNFSGRMVERADEIYAPVTLLSQELERALEAPIRAALRVYSDGVPLRRAERDAIVLQISGSSPCKVYHDTNEPGSFSHAWEGLLADGDAFYLPRGWWIENEPGARPVVQLIFDIENPTGADLLAWLVEKVKEHEAFQKDIPRFADPATRADYRTGLIDQLSRFLRIPGLLDRYRRETNLNTPAGSRMAAPWTPAASEHDLIAIVTPRRIRIKRVNDETILLMSMRKRLAFPQKAAALVHYLCDKAPVSTFEFYRSFEDEFGRAALAEFLSLLSREGIIGLRQPDSI